MWGYMGNAMKAIVFDIDLQFQGHWWPLKGQILAIFTPEPLRVVGYYFHPWCPDGRAGGGKKFVLPVSRKP